MYYSQNKLILQGILMEIYKKIKFIRESLELNQKEFAEKLNITQSTVSKYEKNERIPDFHVLKNLFENFNVNPNWIFEDVEPPILDVDEDNISVQNKELIKDIDLILSPEAFNKQLNKIIFDHTILQLAGDKTEEKSTLRKFLEAIKLEGHIPFRPLLFLYYIFRYVQDNKNEINKIVSYKDYLIDLVRRYNVLSFKNNPVFTSKIKKQFEASIQLNLTETDCKRLLSNYEDVLENIESKMSPAIVISHRKIDTKILFPK